MMKRQSSFHIKLLPLLEAVFRDPASLRLGISGEAGSRRFALLRKGPGDTARLLAWGNDLPLVIRLLLPAVAYADTGMLLVYIVAGEIGDEDPDAWIDRNEDRLIPSGFTSDRIATDYVVDGNEVVAMSAVETARDALCAELEKYITIVSLRPPLQGLATLYRQVSESPWVLWKIGVQGSVMARIEGGKVRDVCHYWADSEAFVTDPLSVIREAGPLLRSIAGNGSPLRVMCWTPDDTPQCPDREALLDCQLIAPHELPGLPRRCHEAYGNALYSGAQVQLLPFYKRQRAEALLRTWCTMFNTLRTAAAALILLAVLAAAFIGVNRLLIYRDRAAMVNIDKRYYSLQVLSSRRDSIVGCIRELAEFSAGESAIACLLSDFQTAVPEGMKAEELIIAERDADSWRLTIRAFALSSSLVQSIINNLQRIGGIQDVRMVYSEQVSGKGMQRGLRIKMEAIWR